MKKNLSRILSAILVLCMIPAMFITALAHGPGVANDETENQSIDNANGQFIPETIQVDGYFKDNGWDIDNWNYVTSATGTWNAVSVSAQARELMYQYQLRKDNKHFYAGATVVLPDGITEATFTVYLEDFVNTSSNRAVTSGFVFTLKDEKVSVRAEKANEDLYSDGRAVLSEEGQTGADGTVVMYNDRYLLEYRYAGDGKYYFEFRNRATDSYRPDENKHSTKGGEIYYYVSVDITDTDGNKKSLYHPINAVSNGDYNLTPSASNWTGGGNVVNPLNGGGEAQSVLDDVVTVDGKFDETLWVGLTDYYTSGKTVTEYKSGTSKNLVSIDTVKYIGNGSVGKYDFRADDNYFFGAIVSTAAATLTANGKSIAMTEKITGDFYRYEFKVPLSEVISDGTVSYSVAAEAESSIGTVTPISGTASDYVYVDGVFNESIWLVLACGDGTFDKFTRIPSSYTATGIDNFVYEIKADYEYIYGAVIIDMSEGETWDNSVYDAEGRHKSGHTFRLWVTPQGVTENYNRKVIDFSIDGDEKQASRVWSEYADEKRNFVTDYNYNGGRGLEYIVTRSDDKNVVYIEFKVDISEFGWESSLDPEIIASPAAQFGYYVLVEEGATNNHFFHSKGRTDAQTNIFTYASTGIDPYYDAQAATLRFNDMAGAVLVDGNLEEEVWSSENLINADPTNSTVFKENDWGNNISYDYRVYSGDDYLYGAAVLDFEANDSTMFTLWIDNNRNEYEWIGDNDPETPHISYDITEYSGATASGFLPQVTITNGVPNVTPAGELDPWTNLQLKYYRNYRYVFRFDGAEEWTGNDYSMGKYYNSDDYIRKHKAAEPDYYFIGEDGDYESADNKVYIKRSENYDFIYRIIDGKTYLEFMVDLKNFHYDADVGFRYITSVETTFDDSDFSGNNQSDLVVYYHPVLEENSQFYLTGINDTTVYNRDSVGEIYTNWNDFEANMIPSGYWYYVEFAPVSGSSTKYEIVQIIDGLTDAVDYKYDANGNKIQKGVNSNGTPNYYWNVRELLLDRTYAFTEADEAAGHFVYVVNQGTTYNNYAKLFRTKETHGDDASNEIYFPLDRPIAMKKVKGSDGKYYYLNNYVIDGRNPHAQHAVSSIRFANWRVGDKVELKYRDEAVTVNSLKTHDALYNNGDNDLTDKIFGVDTTKNSNIGLGNYIGNETYVVSKNKPYTFAGNYDSDANGGGWHQSAGQNYATGLTDGKKNLAWMAHNNASSEAVRAEAGYVYGYGSAKPRNGNEDTELAVTINLGNKTTKTNIYTVYLTDGSWGVDVDGVYLEVYGSNDGTNWNYVSAASKNQQILRTGTGDAKKNADGTEYVSSDVLSTYTLSAVSYEKNVSYQYIKMVMKVDADISTDHYIWFSEVEAAYIPDLEKLPRRNIVHIETNQGTTNNSANFLGYNNTTGEFSGTFVETVIFPDYTRLVTNDPSFYSEFNIQRVEKGAETVRIAENAAKYYTPDFEKTGSNASWNYGTTGIVEPLKHVSPDVVKVDGNLNDSGWDDNKWTPVDGLFNATNYGEGTGTDFKYQLRTDGEYLYVAAVIDSAYTAEKSPEFRIWLKDGDSATTFTNYYSVGYGETVFANVDLPATTGETVADALEILSANAVYDYDAKTLTYGNKIVAAANINSAAGVGEYKVNIDGYADSLIFGTISERLESTHDGVWVWEAHPQTLGFRFANEGAMMSSAEGKIIEGVTYNGTDKTIVEFKVKLNEFNGENGFEYFVEATTNSGTTIYPHVRKDINSDDGHLNYSHPAWNWDSVDSIKVAAEEISACGEYRMINDYAPMTSLGAKVNDDYGTDKVNAIRFGARYTEEFIRRQNVIATESEQTDYWDVADAGIVILPSYMLSETSKLTLDNSNTAHASAQDIINWRNQTADSKTNFADYESFVFYVNLTGIPDTMKDMEFSFCGYIDYYSANGSETYYGIPLERSFNLVQSTANEDTELPENSTEH